MLGNDQERRVASVLEGLNKATAPSGFESKVIQRIADTEKKEGFGRPMLLIALKFAAPAAVLLFVGVFFVFFGDSGVNWSAVPAVDESPIQPASARDQAIANGVIASAGPEFPAGEKPAGPNLTKKTNIPSTDYQPVRSEDFAVNRSANTLLPPGIDPRPRNIQVPVGSASGGSPIGEVLGMFGISSQCGTDGCTVITVAKGGLAERAKLAAGDRIVSINGRKVDGSTMFSGANSFRAFEVVRGGRTLTLSLSVN